MATVYLAEETLSRRLVALKVLHCELARSQEARRRFISEMQILTTLEHPNLVRCYHCDDIDGQLMMALEYVRGRTLRGVLDEHVRVPASEACRIAIGVLGALHVAHTNDPPIVHRDLKPENILLGDDGVIKVADFGIAKMLGSEAITTTPHGTLQYMSPEQFEGLPTTAGTDLYSLGIVLYEMLVGQRPFLGRAPLEIIRAHHSATPPPFPEAVAREVPPRLVELVFALLRKEPAHRPPSAQTVQSQIVQIVQSQPQPASTTGGGPQGGPVWTPPAASGPIPAAPHAPCAPPTSEPIDTVGLIERFEERSRGGGGRVALSVLLVLLGVLSLLGLGAFVVLAGADDADAPQAKRAERAIDAAGTEPTTRSNSSAKSRAKVRVPPVGSSRAVMSEFLEQRDPGGPVPEHPELQISDYTVKVMVRRDLVEAQRGARIVADTIVNGERPRVQIIRRPRRGSFQHWVVVGRYPTRSRAVADRGSLRSILNQGAIHVLLSDRCSTLGPVIDGVRDCIPL